jgi:hypothetical protein
LLIILDNKAFLINSTINKRGSAMSNEARKSVLTKPKANRLLLILGVVLITTGIVLSFVLSPVADSVVWLDQTFTVPEGGYEHFSRVFSSPDTVLQIRFDVTQGGVIDFWVLDEANFANFTAGRHFNYYSVPSAARVGGKELGWVPFLGSNVYFVWDNPDYSTSKSVHAVIELKSITILTQNPEFPVPTFIWLPIFLIGLSLIGVSLRPLTPASSFRKKIMIGYALVVLGGLPGIALGLYLRGKEGAEAKFHGYFILGAGVLAAILYVMSVFY